MDKETQNAFINLNQRFNNNDERFNQIEQKLDNYHGRKTKEILTALIGSPVITVIVVAILNL